MSKAAKIRIAFMSLQLLVIAMLIVSWFIKDLAFVSKFRLVAYGLLIALVVFRVAKPSLLRGNPPAQANK
jgi:dipeptide/tripeptide permease